MNIQKDEMVAKWIKENANPAIENLTRINQETASKVSMMMEQKGLNTNELAKLVDTQITEVNKWLSGKHNFSEKMLSFITDELESKN